MGEDLNPITSARNLTQRMQRGSTEGIRTSVSYVMSISLQVTNASNEDGVIGEEEVVDHKAEAPTDLVEIAFHAILGKTSSTVKKLQGTIQGRKVLILVDGGSTHNLISHRLVE